MDEETTLKKHPYKFPKILYTGDPDVQGIFDNPEDTIEIEEKVDGGNGAFWLDDEGNLHLASRNFEIGETHNHFKEQIKWLMENLAIENVAKSFVYYVEWMAKHTIKYTNAPPVIGLDIWTKESKMFLTRELKQDIFSALNVPVVNLVWEGKIKDCSKDLNQYIGPSNYYEGIMEGIVVKNYRGEKQYRAKLVDQRFKEKNYEVFGEPEKKKTEDEKFIEGFVTEARISKTINKLTSEKTLHLNMELMKELPKSVLIDTFEESAEDILKFNKSIDFGQIKRLTSKKCAKVLSQKLQGCVVGTQ